MLEVVRIIFSKDLRQFLRQNNIEYGALINIRDNIYDVLLSKTEATRLIQDRAVHQWSPSQNETVRQIFERLTYGAYLEILSRRDLTELVQKVVRTTLDNLCTSEIQSIRCGMHFDPSQNERSPVDQIPTIEDMRTAWSSHIKGAWFPIDVGRKQLAIIANVHCIILYPREVSGELLPATVWAHGGAFQAGTGMNEHAEVTRMVNCGQIFVCPEPRKAPEHPFPAFIDDVHKVSVELRHRDGNRFNIDPSRVSVAGLSTGGSTALTIAYRERERKHELFPILRIAAVAPVINHLANDDDQCRIASDQNVGMSPKRMSESSKRYMSSQAFDRAEADLNTLTIRELRKVPFPEVLIAIMSFDMLAGEQIEFVSKLKATQKHVQVIKPDLPHEGLIMGGLWSESRQLVAKVGQFLTR